MEYQSCFERNGGEGRGRDGSILFPLLFFGLSEAFCLFLFFSIALVFGVLNQGWLGDLVGSGRVWSGLVREGGHEI